MKYLTKSLLCAATAALCLTSATFAGQTVLSDNFSTAIGQDPHLNVIDFQNGSFIQGSGPDWSVTSGSGQLTIGLTPLGATELSPSNFNNGPHAITGPIASGDFIGKVDMDISHGDQMAAQFFIDTPTTYFGIDFSPWGIHVSDGLGFSVFTPPPSATSGTFELVRSGDEITALYEATGASQFTTLADVSDPGLSGSTGFDLTAFLNKSSSPYAYPNSVSFSNYSVVSTVPDAGATLSMVGGAFAALAALRRRFAK